MTEVQGFDSIDEMMEYMAHSEREANKRVSPGQAQIKPGDHVIRLADLHGLKVLIVGKTYSVDEWVKLEHDAYDKYPDELPFDEQYERERYQERIERGYLSGMWYSVLETQGEVGDAHRSVLAGVMPEPIFDAILALIQNRA